MINKLLLRLISKSYYKAVNESFRNANISITALKEKQLRKLKNIILHAKKNVPYYRNILNGIDLKDIEELQTLPILTKQIITDNFDLLCAGNFKAKRQKLNSTSGSVGSALNFLSDRKTDYIRWACTVRGDSWTGWVFGEPKLIIWGSAQDSNKSKNIIKKILNSKYIFNSKIILSFNMTDEDMNNIVNEINYKKPKLIIGYPSTLELFSSFLISNNRQIVCPIGIITGGETLFDQQREIIQKAFQCKVLNRYGCREVGHIANECDRQNGLHISSDHVIVEIINEKGELCKPGELGEIVVTDLDNYVFPFIRYRIGDIGVLSDRICDCGKPFPILERVEGRVFDLIVGINGNHVPGNFFSLMFRHEIEGVKRFQILQESIKKLEIKVEADEKFTEEEEKKMKLIVKRKLGDKMDIYIQKVNKIKETKAGKFRWVISKISPFSKTT